MPWISWFFAMIAASGMTYATSFIERPFPESVQEAPMILRGKVGTPVTDWGKAYDGSRRIYTYYPIDVQETFKGTPDKNRVQMREMGGEKDGVGMQVPGTAHFTPGEEVVVFLGDKNPDGSHDVWGLMMGKFDLVRDENGNEFIRGPGIGSGDPQGLVDEDSMQSSAQKWSLQNLRDLIRKQSAAPASPTRIAATASPRATGIVPTAPPQALPLQPQASVEPTAQADDSAGSGLRGHAIWLVAGIGLFAVLFWLKRRK